MLRIPLMPIFFDWFNESALLTIYYVVNHLLRQSSYGGDTFGNNSAAETIFTFASWKWIWSEHLNRSSCPEVFCKKGVVRNFAKFTGKHLCRSLFFKVAGLRPATLLKKRLWHRCFPVNFAKFQRTTFLIEHLRWLLLIWSNHKSYYLN